MIAPAAPAVQAGLAGVLTAGLARLDPISLDEVGGTAVADRVDTKFLLPAAVVPLLLEQLVGGYRVLEVDGTRLARYSTLFYDTAGLQMYHAHHSGRSPRYKVRVRSYLDSGSRFLEVKRKNNRGRTSKARLRLDATEPPLRALQRQPPLGVERAIPLDELLPTILVEFSRASLVSRTGRERLTVDVALRFSRGAATVSLPHLAIVELKQERNGSSPFLKALRPFRSRPGAISKYCLGITQLHPDVRRNNFLPLMRRIARITPAGPILG
jgi:hypothetical protein